MCDNKSHINIQRQSSSINTQQSREQVTKEQQKRVDNDQYLIRRKEAALYYEQADQLGNERVNYLRNHVRTAIVENLGIKRYEAFDDLKIKRADDEPEAQIKLNHATGSRLALNGEDVIEFNIAGSGFRYPRMEHKELVGWDDTDEYREEELKVHWYNKTKLLTWLPKIKTKAHIEELNQARLEKNRQIDEIYGKKAEEKVGGRTLNHLRKKASVNDKNASKTKFSICGPNAVNIGKYSEDNLEEYILELGKSVLQGKFREWGTLSDAEIEEVKPVNILIQGHSRGGVAAGLGAMRLKRWVADNYPQFLNKIRFDLLQYDPVAGAIENYGNNEMIDHAPADKRLARKDPRYMSLGEEANTTVMYSMHTQHAAAFTPQLVKNPKRIILNMADHGVNLFQTDISQEGAPTRVTYLAEKNGRIEAFRSSGLGELDNGVYITDDQNNLIRLKSLEEYDALAKPLLKGSKSQSSRHEVIREAVKTWFETNGDQPDAGEIREPLEEEKEKKQELQGAPGELAGAVSQKEKLDKMPRETEEQRIEYAKREIKYITARRSGMKAYADRLSKEKGSYITGARKEYLYLLADLSYQLEMIRAEEGREDEKRQEKVSEILRKLKAHPEGKDPDSFTPGFLQKELYAGTKEELDKLFEKYKTEEKLPEKEREEEKKGTPWDRQITDIFREVTNKIFDTRHDDDLDMDISDEIWSRLEKERKDDSISLKQFRSAVKEVKDLAKRLRSGRSDRSLPDTDRLMSAMTRLSETANIFYDEHRGHQYSDRGKQHRQACDMVREITRRFYDRLDIAMGGKGYGNITEKKADVRAEDKKLSRIKMEELVKVYGSWKKHFAKQEGMERTNIRDRARLFEPYMQYIDTYRATHGIKDWPKEIEEVIRSATWCKVQNTVIVRYEINRKGFSDPLVRLAAKRADEKAGRKKAEKDLTSEEIDAGLTPEQIKAVDAIDRWFLRNYNNGGIAGSMTGVRNHHGEIVSSLLRKSKRERLYIYYLIETRQRKNPELFDVYASQTYTPSLERFKDRMLASKFKLMSRIMGDYVYMGKVTESLQIGRDHQDLIRDFAKLDMKQREVKGKELEELKKKKEEYRSYMLVRTLKSTKDFRDAALVTGNKGKKKTKDADLEAKKNTFLNDLQELIRADEAVAEASRYGGSLGETETDESGKISVKKSDKYYSVKDSNLIDAQSNTDTWAMIGAGAAENGNMVVNPAIVFANTVTERVNKVSGVSIKPIEWRLKDSSLMNTKLYMGAVTATTISALGGLMNACYSIYSLTQNWDDMHGYDRAAGVAGILKSAAATGAVVAKGIETGGQYSEFASRSMEAEAVTSKVVKGFGIAAAGIQTAINMYTAVSGKLDRKNTDNAKKLLSERLRAKQLEKLSLHLESEEARKKREAAETPEERERREKELKKAEYERNMLKLSKDMSNRKKKYAGIQTLGSSLSVAGFAVPGAGLIATAAGAGISFLAGVLSSMKLTGIREQMFDTYFGFEDFMKNALEELKDRGQTVYDMDEFRTRMRRVLAASAGYADIPSACDQIAKKYADVICTGLYGPAEERASGDVRAAYIQLVKSFGLPYDEKKRIPSPALLARRMAGK